MIVTGVDLSLTASGVARVVASGGRVSSIAVQTVSSQPVGKSVEARLDRLRGIVYDVEDLFAPGGLVVLEAPAYTRSVGARHERSGLWWMVAQAAHRAGCRVVEVAPTTRARYATGRGGAGKADVLWAMRDEWSGVGLSNDNEADALALAMLGLRLVGSPVDLSHPHRVESVSAVRGEL